MAVDGDDVDVAATVVVNAAGVWADDVRALDEATHPNSIRPAKGIHLTVPWKKVRNDIAVVIPVPKDKRSLFVVPWGDFTYVGTTDTDYDGPIDDPQCTREDLEYVLRALNASVTTGVTEADVTGTWAGLRPLVKGAPSGRTADLSRRHKVAVSPAGLVSVTGGKLTTYRRMAADAVDMVMDRLDRRGARTKRLRLLGGTATSADGDRRLSPAASLRHAKADVGRSAPRPTLPPHSSRTVLRGGGGVCAARHEMARSVDASCPAAPGPACWTAPPPAAARRWLAAAPELGWDDAGRPGS